MDCNRYEASDLDPFLVGFTGSTLLLKLMEFCSKGQFLMMHLDSTFKITKNAYSLLIFGVSGLSRKFYIFAAFLVSQTTEAIVTHWLRALLTVLQPWIVNSQDGVQIFILVMHILPI